MGSRDLLMIPGPVEYEPEVMGAFGARTGSHVGAQFIATFGRALKALRQLFLAPTAQPFVLAGSGTLAMELAVANLVEPGDAVLAISTGYFGDRMVAILERHGATVEPLRSPAGGAPSLGEIARALDSRHYKLVTVTHVDTSTGVLAPVEPIARMACEHGTLSLVDAVCSAGGEELRQEDWGVDVAVTASQKALGVPPGLAIASVGARALAAYRARRHPVRSFTCDWGQWLPVLQAYERGDAAYFATPPVNTINALERSLQLILEEGLEPRIYRHRRMALALRAAWRSLQLGAHAAHRGADGAHHERALLPGRRGRLAHRAHPRRGDRRGRRAPTGDQGALLPRGAHGLGQHQRRLGDRRRDRPRAAGPGCARRRGRGAGGGGAGAGGGIGGGKPFERTVAAAGVLSTYARAGFARGMRMKRSTDLNTWDEIQEAFPDEWVVLDRVRHSGYRVERARVLSHSPARKTALELSRELRGRRWALEFTGPLHVPEGWIGFVVARRFLPGHTR
ncbi:MAG: aminotransferase class V-fold PLP-dependent enzyme [Myxococcales bacterium]